MLKDVEQMPDFPALEKEIMKFWDDTNAFQKLQEKNRGHKKWSFFDGPITANNPMGVHHAWGRTYKDIFMRHRAMKGYEERYQNGFDCQGLWVEVVVEKELNLNSKPDIVKYGLDNFSRKCRERVEKYSKIQRDQSKRLGQWMDWDHSYYTMSDTNIETIWHFLKVCHERGWLYQGHRCMPWCTRCGTSLSQHELHESYKDLKHRTVMFHLPFVERPGEYIMVWTTTPWTLAANTAVAVHPELNYAKIEWEGKIIYLSEGTLGHLKKGYKLLGSVKGRELVGLHYKGPVHIPARENIELKVVPWDAVGDDEGTGVVHIAPGCGAEDFELGKAEGLKVIVPIDESGYYVDESFGELYGKNTDEAADIVFEHLKAHDYLYKVEEYEHRYPVCWRCQKELVFRLVDEWFIRCDEIREPMKKAAAEVEWTPDYAGLHMQNWLDNMGDWCISRRRFWGLPLPLYKCPKCGKWTVIGSKKELEKAAVSGMEQLQELHRPWIDNVKIRCQHCGQEGLTRVTEVGDCWLDAGIIPFSTLNYLDDDKTYWKEWFPCEFITEMIEQVRLWFYSQLFMSVTLTGRAPYKRVLTYSAVVDENGEYFSKTKGNAIPFDVAAEKMGADVMRWMYAGQNIRTNLRFGYKIAEDVRRKLINFWNVYKFFVTYAKLDKADLTKKIDREKLPDMDKWLLARLHSCLVSIENGMESYDSSIITKEVESFWDDLSNWYLRRSRRRFWKSENDQDKDCAYYTLYTTLTQLCYAIAPILPFLTEYMYQNLVRNVKEDAPESIHHNDYPESDKSFLDDTLVEDMAIAMNICTLGHSARDDAKVKVRQPLQRILIKTNDEKIKRGATRFQDIIKDELNVKAIEFIETDSDEFYCYDIKPNLKILGRKLGAKINALKEALATADTNAIGKAVERNEAITIDVAGESMTLQAEELLCSKKMSSTYYIAQDKDLTVVLDINITEELIVEGAMRDLVRQIQNMRKEADFQVSDLIRVRYATESNLLQKALDTFQSYICQETLCKDLRKETPTGKLVKDMTIADEKITFAVELL